MAKAVPHRVSVQVAFLLLDRRALDLGHFGKALKLWDEAKLPILLEPGPGEVTVLRQALNGKVFLAQNVGKVRGNDWDTSGRVTGVILTRCLTCQSKAQTLGVLGTKARSDFCKKQKERHEGEKYGKNGRMRSPCLPGPS